MTEVHIFRPDPVDALQICTLYGTTWLDTYPNEEHGITLADIQMQAIKMTAPDRVARFSEYLVSVQENPARYFRVAKVRGRVVGVCGAAYVEEVVHLASLYVLPAEQGKGVGRFLMEALLQWADPDTSIRLNVVTYNHHAISFYEKWGFVDTGKRFTAEKYIMDSGNRLPEMEMVRAAKHNIHHPKS